MFVHALFYIDAESAVTMLTSFSQRWTYKKHGTRKLKLCKHMFSFLSISRNHEIGFRRTIACILPTSLPELPIQLRVLRKNHDFSQAHTNTSLHWFSPMNGLVNNVCWNCVCDVWTKFWVSTRFQLAMFTVFDVGSDSAVRICQNISGKLEKLDFRIRKHICLIRSFVLLEITQCQ